MTFDQALKRIGVTIVKTENGQNKVILLLRVNPKQADLWNDTLTEYLLASADRRVNWTTDVSKYFYPVPDQGVVKYLWRVILSGNPRAAAEAMGRAAQRAIAAGVEVTSQPLVGRREYEFDPARGKIAGAHGVDSAATILANALGAR
jgi:hypothetical protein